VRKWLTLISLVFAGALLLAPVAGAQEGEEEQPASPGPTQQTISMPKEPRAPRYLEAKHGVVPGPEVDRDDDPVFNDPRDPMEIYDRRSNTPWAQAASPSSGSGLTTGIGTSGGSVLAAAGRSGVGASSLATEARRSIKKLIRELDGD